MDGGEWPPWMLSEAGEARRRLKPRALLAPPLPLLRAAAREALPLPARLAAFPPPPLWGLSSAMLPCFFFRFLLVFSNQQVLWWKEGS